MSSGVQADAFAQRDHGCIEYDHTTGGDREPRVAETAYESTRRTILDRQRIRQSLHCDRTQAQLYARD